MTPQKPLMLKDFLDLDSDSCNSFRCISRHVTTNNRSLTVRFLLQSELCGGPHRTSTKPNTFTKISTAITNAVRNLPISSPTRPRPRPRTGPKPKPNKTGFFSKRLSFWKKSEKEVVRVKDIVRLSSFEFYGERTILPPPSENFASPPASSCSSCSGNDNSYVSITNFSTDESSTDSYVGREIINKREVEKEDKEKEQSSPVSVLDFVSEEDEDDDKDDDEDDNNDGDSPSFNQSVANLERRRNQLLQNIRRFESLADLDPIDLNERFTNMSSDDEEDEITASSLVRKFTLIGPNKKLVHDFFEEELTWSVSVDELVSAVEGWIRGEGHLAAKDHGKAQIKDMERNGRWRVFGEGKDDVAADVEVGLLGSLLEELVFEL